MPGNKRRAVLILHPDFDQDGKPGILAAKEFAEQFLDSQDDLLKAVRANQSSNVALALERHIKRMRVIVRKIDEDIL